jgi:alpha-L-fucosidase
VVVAVCILFGYPLLAQENYPFPVREGHEATNTGKFESAWESLKQYEVPEWFRHAKFHIWAHRGPQCQTERGDWYARVMYEEGSDYYKWHGYVENNRDFIIKQINNL